MTITRNGLFVSSQFQFQPGALVTLPRERVLETSRRQLQAGAFYRMAGRDDVLVQTTGDGPDFVALCVGHQWAGRGVTRLDDLEHCPFCEAELTGGRERYAALQGISINGVYEG
jgi:hypothetical protein